MKRDVRFLIGVSVSIAWLSWMGWQLWSRGLPSELNAQGDFFAGYFAPLAFLWLVLGYIQQGEELRQSSESLRLQAEELKNSVEQQSQLVEVSRKQLEQEALALQEERQRRIDALRPRFLLGHQGYSGANGQFNVPVVFQNEGGTSVDTVVVLEAPEGRRTIVDHVLIKRGGSTSQVVALHGGIWHGEIDWKDEAGNRGIDVFALRMEGSILAFDQPKTPTR